jgi:metal-responsive CopG/Arc/MetJ family transcriptional regulator
MRETITVSLPEDLKKELDEITRKEGISRSDLVRASLRSYLTIRRYRRIRQRLVAKAKAKGILTDGDVFERIS